MAAVKLAERPKEGLITFTAANIVNNGMNNTFQVTFPAGTEEFHNTEVALVQFATFFDWFNITALNGNNQLPYIWIDGVTYYAGQSLSNLNATTIPDGFYEVADLNAILEQAMYGNGQFLYDPTGTPVYFLNLTTNPTYYAIQLTSTPLPTAIGASPGDAYYGYTWPNWGWGNSNGGPYPVVPNGGRYKPAITVPSNPNAVANNNGFDVNFNTYSMSSYLGFDPGTYPTTADQKVNAIFTYLSAGYVGNPTGYPATFTEEVSPVQAVVVSCNLVTGSTLASNNKALYAFTPGSATPGQTISNSIFNPIWVQIPDQTRGSSFVLTLSDQSGRPLTKKDPQGIFILQVRARR